MSDQFRTKLAQTKEETMEKIYVYYAQGKHWANTEQELKRMGELPVGMDYIFHVEQKEDESTGALKLRAQIEASDRGIAYVVNL